MLEKSTTPKSSNKGSIDRKRIFAGIFLSTSMRGKPSLIFSIPYGI
jgi:hypothetical protein